MRHRIVFLTLALICARVGATTDGSAPDPVAELAARARALRIAESTAWLRLGHWRSSWLGGYESEADGPRFFLAPDGKGNPEAELEATIRAVFAPESPEGTAPALGGTAEGSATEEPAQCRFPARYAYLARVLEADPGRFPIRECPGFQRFWDRLSARSVTLVFSSYYLNNPASAFGHTFLRLARTEHGTSGDRLDLVDQGVDYAAVADTGNAILYALKGLAGLFRGEFTARPYFYKVREYADYESRDLWEYELDLTPGEVAMLVAHLWELGHTWFDYYYVTENCSYHVLGAIEAAAPRLELLRHVGKVTLPADTVKALFATPGLVRGVRFRPSGRSQLAARIATLSDEQLGTVVALADGGQPAAMAGASPADRARWLDAAVDLVDVRHGREFIEGQDTPASRLRQSLLERRSMTGVIGEPIHVPPPASGGPERGHGSARLALGAGASTRDGPLLGIEGRLALHDLVDPPAGFPLRTQLEFLKFRASYATRDRWLRLDEATFVEATSLNVFDRLEKRIAWKMKAGATRVLDAGCRDCVAGRFEVGGGPALVLRDGAIATMVTADAELLASPPLQGAGGSAFRPGVGPGLLARVLVGDRFALLATATWRWLPAAAPDTTFQIGATGRVHLGPFSIACDWRRTPLAHEGMLSILMYGG